MLFEDLFWILCNSCSKEYYYNNCVAGETYRNYGTYSWHGWGNYATKVNFI